MYLIKYSRKKKKSDAEQSKKLFTRAVFPVEFVNYFILNISVKGDYIY